MSIPALIQTYEEVRRLAVAGSAVAPGDFRLKKLLPTLEQAGAKAPVFAKVAQAVGRLVESDEKSSAPALLELATLVNAILYTQGETGLAGELVPIESVDLGRPKTQASARVLKPLQEALTTTGGGRMEVIREAFERGAFHDFRLISPALAALDDTYAEIADFMAESVLPLYGRAIVSQLQEKFDAKGKAGHGRRLKLMHRLDRDAARPFVRRALDEGTQEIRIAAIGCLGDSPEDLPFLFEQSQAKAKDVRTAALKALGSSHSDDAVTVLRQSMDNADLALAVVPIRANRNPKLTAFLHEAAEKQFDSIVNDRRWFKTKLGEQCGRLCLLLDCLVGRDDRQTEELLVAMFAQREKLLAVKGEPSGKDVFERLTTVMATGPAKAQAALIDAHTTLAPEILERAFEAARHGRKPAEVFAMFSPYLAAKIEGKKGLAPAALKCEAIVERIVSTRNDWWFYGRSVEQFDSAKNLDPRWLDLALNLGRADLVKALAVPGHVKANEYLATLFQQHLAKSGDEHLVITVLDPMIRVGHPTATDATVELIRAATKSTSRYGWYWVDSLIPRLPKAEAVPKLEALLPTLPEKWMDHVLDAVTELKNS